ncbi:MAG: tyrosine recombinase XerC [Ruminococcaceae bacterium]|nr:tyrosine recombinase XerC [Oscillospiraceae bacterium]
MNREKLNIGFPILKDFILYCETIKGKSEMTAEEYFSDLKLLFKFLKMDKGLVPSSLPFAEITVNDIDIEFIKGITISDLYAFIVYCKDERQNGAASRARKVSTISTFFKYLTNTVHLLEKNPALELKQPKQRKSLPVHLSFEECLELLKSIDGPYKERDYAIITLFLNCGMRLSELCSINYTDIKPDGSLKILGKGNKERMIYLNNACQMALEAYMKVRPVDGICDKDKNALFISRNRRRISNKTVQHIVYTFLDKAGLGGQGYSTHKLRHTAATLMYQLGNVDIRVLKDILGHESLGTTQIYTHIANKQVEKALNDNPLSQVKPIDKKD